MELTEASNLDLEYYQLHNKIIRFLNEEKELKDGIDKSLALIGNKFQLSRAYIFENTPDNRYTSNTFEWCAPGVSAQIDNLQNVCYGDYNYLDLFDENDMIICPDIQCLTTAQQQLLGGQDIKAILQCGLYEKGEFFGFIGFDDCYEVYPDWIKDPNIKRSLNYIAKLISVCLRKERNLEKAEQYHTQLEESLQTEKQLRLQTMEAIESQMTFLSNISHDMRTPLNGVLGFTKMAIQSDSMKEIKEYLRIIDNSGKLLLNLINDTLNLSKIQSHSLSLSPKIFQAKDLLYEIIDTIRIELQKKQLQLVIDTSQCELGAVYADELRIKQILNNLLSNSIKFTPPNGTIRFIAKYDKKDPTHMCHITISDTGIGMSKEFVPHAFEPFAQDEKNIAVCEANGTGLGLSIVKEIIEILNGTISLESAPKEGTTFYIHFPIEPVDEQKEPVIQTEIMEDLNGKKILVCEDHPINLALAKKILEKKGASITSAVNGQIAYMDFVQSRPGEFDAILMDMRMPVMDGLEATVKIRQCKHPDAKTIPIIAMTANAFESDREACLNAGMNDYLSKPIQPDSLYAVLTKYLIENE